MDDTLYIDGGLSCNLPIGVFDDKHTLFFRIAAFKPTKIGSWKDFIFNTLSCSLEYQRTVVKNMSDINLLEFEIEYGNNANNITLLDEKMVNIGHNKMVQILYPEVEKIIETLVSTIMVKYLSILSAKEEHLSCNEAFATCDTT